MMSKPSPRELSWIATVTLSIALPACADTAGPEQVGDAVAIEAVSGDAQSGVVGQEVPQVLVARVLDAAGRPVPGQLVSFVVTAGGGRVHAGWALTTAQGEARERWTLGTVAADSQRVEARALDQETGQALVSAVFRSTARAGPPATVRVAPRFTSYTGTVVPMSATVSDAFGNRIRETPVAWTVRSGGGTVSPATSTTDSAGLARTQWTLGPQPGPNLLEATSQGRTDTVTVVTETPLLPPGPIASRMDGIARTITLSWPAPPLSRGYNVYWSTSPGVTPATGTKIADVRNPFVHSDRPLGVPHYYVVTVIYPGGESGPSAEVAVTVAPFRIDVSRPTEAEVVPDSVLVDVNVASLYELASVIATVDGRSAPLRYVSPGRWFGHVDLGGQASGQKTLVVTARDLLGGEASESRRFLYDRRPEARLVEPVEFAVVSPAARFAVQCIDDDPGGCASVSLMVNDMESPAERALVTRMSSFEETVTLAGYEGRTVLVWARATDRSGQVVQSIPRRIHVLSTGAGLTQIASVRGRVLDTDGDRVLHFEDAPGGSALRIFDRRSGAETLLQDEPGRFIGTFCPPYCPPMLGRLTPVGAMYQDQSPEEGLRRLREWRQGTPLTLQVESLVNRSPQFTLAGRYALYRRDWDIVRRDVFDGTELTVYTSAPDGPQGEADRVSASGEVYYRVARGTPFSGPPVGSDLYRWRDGVVTQLNTQPGWAGWVHRDVGIGDGFIVYGRSSPSPRGSVPSGQLMLYRDGEIPLTDPVDNYFRGLVTHAVNGRWIAYLKPGSSNQLQVWVRRPDGTDRQATFFASSSSVEALGPDGVLVYANHELRKRWVALPDYGAPVEIAYNEDSRVLFVGARLFMVLGRAAFAVAY